MAADEQYNPTGILDLYLSSPTHPDENAPYLDSDPSFEWYAGSRYGNAAAIDQYQPGNANRIAIAGQYAYLAKASWENDHWAGYLLIVDISNPANPTLVSSYQTQYAVGVAVNGNHAYLARAPNAIDIINISDPANPFLEGTYIHSGQAFGGGIAVSGSFLYSGGGVPGRIHVIDVSNPANPVHLGSRVMPSYVQSIVVRGQYLYVANAYAGIQILDVSNPANPIITGHGDMPSPYGFAVDVALNNNLALVPDHYGHLVAFDVSNPANPAVVSSYDTSNAYSVATSGNFAYIGIDYGLEIVDISDPSNPAFYDFNPMPAHAFDVTVEGSEAYISLWDGLQIAHLGPVQVSYVLDQAPATVPDNIPDIGAAPSQPLVQGTHVHVFSAAPGQTSVSFSDLPPGDYYFHAVVVDGGNVGRVSHRKMRIASVCGQSPELALQDASPYWSSYGDYLARKLSVAYSVVNSGASAARNVSITGAEATGGVMVDSVFPIALGDVAEGGSHSVTLEFTIPAGIGRFRSSLSGYGEDICNNGFSYGI
ncbi:MAG: hypothetical protein Q7K29_04085 [Thermoleophilia bacterium]|nr:hypothetical protein [Thermoleophilia bacterium]